MTPSAAKTVTEIFIVLALILLNGLFALSELAVVSARIPRLEAMASAGRHGAATAVALASNPGRFLSAVQIGITCISIVNGVFSGETFGVRAVSALTDAGLPATIAGPAGYGAVIALITYLSVVAGELVPKSLALRNAEAIACRVAPAMAAFSRVAAPAIWLLDASTRLVFRLFGQSTVNEATVTDEEIRALIAEAERTGVLEQGERALIAGVMRLADRTVTGLMTPRADVDWIEITANEAPIRERLISTPHSRLPVAEGSADNMIGVIQTRDVLSALLAEKPFAVRPHLRPAPVIPESMNALAAIEVLREAEVPMALIHDEYGHFAGIVTPADILEAVAGVFRSDIEGSDTRAARRDDGSWLVPGSMPVDEMAELIGIAVPPARGYDTVAGFVLSLLRQFPQTGEWVEASGWRFEVVDLDGRRIDKVLVSRARTVPHRMN